MPRLLEPRNPLLDRERPAETARPVGPGRLLAPVRPYGELLALRRVRKPTFAVALASIPIGALSLAVLLLTQQTGHGAAVTGVVAGALSLGTGLGILLQGRLMDRFGITPVLLVAATLQAVALVAFVAAARGGTTDGFLVALAFAAGFGEPQVGGALRALWPALASRRLHPVANAWSSVLLQTTILAGPVLLAAALPSVGAAGAVLLCGLMFFVGATLLATGRSARMLGARSRDRSRRFAPPPHGTGDRRSRVATLAGALARPEIRRLALITGLAGAVSGLAQFSAFSAGQEHHDAAITPLFYAALSAGSIVGSFAGGAPSARAVSHRLPRLFARLLAVVMAASFAARLSFAAGHAVVALGLCLVLVGFAVGMLTVTSYVAVGSVAGPGETASAYTSLTAAGLVCSALATSGAGALAAWGGAPVVLLAASAVALAGLMVTGQAARRPGVRRLVSQR